MKHCITCNTPKPLAEFYRHNRMADGHLNKCKGCIKLHSKDRYHDKIQNDGWKGKESKRARKKYHRLDYKNRYVRSSENNKRSNDRYNKKYPEKYHAKNHCHKIVRPPGLELHHWSYNEEHWKDIFFLTRSDHARLHRKMTYDPSAKMYRAPDGSLLDTRGKHDQFIKTVLPAPQALPF